MQPVTTAQLYITEEPLRHLVFDVQNIPDTPWWDRRNSPILFVGLSALKTVPSGA